MYLGFSLDCSPCRGWAVTMTPGAPLDVLHVFLTLYFYQQLSSCFHIIYRLKMHIVSLQRLCPGCMNTIKTETIVCYESNVKLHVRIVFYHPCRLSHMDYHDAAGDQDPEAPGGYYDDDQQPIFQDGCRSPKRRFLSSPQRELIRRCCLSLFCQ